MALFDQMARIEKRAKRQNESSFEYMNTSARTGVGAIRDLLECWFLHLPETATADIRARFRSRDNAQHQSAFYELFWHELLIESNFDVETHPELVDVATNPDFVTKRGGLGQFYLEVTLAMPPGDTAGDRRLAELHDTLDRMNSPDYFLEIEYRGSPTDNIRGRKVRERLEGWLRELNFDEISRLHREQRYRELPTFTWPEKGVLLTFTPIPKGPNTRGQPGVRPVGIVMPEGMRLLRTHDDIRAAIDGKGAKYGALELPLIVAVNVLDDFCDETAIRDALFGEEQLVSALQPDGTWEDRARRMPNGAWYGRNGPRNISVSAVVVTRQLSPSTLRTRTMEIIHNPWAARPLDVHCWYLPHKLVSAQDGRIQEVAGTSAADILNIPDPWPI